ncbi:cytochrome c [Acetobacter nitrogenifigens DSM 23921 = NBRC 105050]|nr:cytochrome c [Acetobacter nitrogenifigens]GBQ90288.1 cytochrome c [Acetobacter nitrogenifigens DSM 23921 = NBRC 105050]
MMAFNALRRRGVLLSACVVVGGLVCAPQVRGAERTGTVSYTAEQAEHGAALYKQNCAVCHGGTLDGAFDTPSLRGRLISNWSGTTLDKVFHYISKAMPLFAPGSLKPADNAAIVAFILRENDVAPGPRELPSDEGALKKISFPSVGGKRAKKTSSTSP